MSWIEECTSSHEQCKSRRDHTLGNPTRLVDIGSKPSDPIKLVHGQDLESGAKYITLSHRWGCSKLPRLTADNLSQFKCAIPINELSNTYLDAFAVSRRLGVRFIWIDSLCIIQDGDDMQDWKTQALLMDQFYKNGFCNISADWGSETLGLFRPRDTTFFLEGRLDLRIGSTETDVLTFYSVDHRLWNREVLNAPLNRRAWVLQERLLNARALHFCRSQIFWECCEKSACETYPDVMPEATGNNDMNTRDIKKFEPTMFKWKHDCLVARLERPLSQREKRSMAWYDLIATYSQCDISYPSDGLVAIAGIASSWGLSSTTSILPDSGDRPCYRTFAGELGGTHSNRSLPDIERRHFRGRRSTMR